MSNIKADIKAIFEDGVSSITALDMSQILGASRPYVSKLMNAMVATGELESQRVAKNIYYFLPSRLVVFDDTLKRQDLNESEVWWKFRDNPKLLAHTTENARGVLQFAFTEMLNNAIDHSQSEEIHITVTINGDEVCFVIRDFGVGVFRNIMKEKHLPDEVTAIQELMKGKLTTAIRAHSGEGIFWTSKCAKYFTLTSYDFMLAVNNEIHDYYIKKLPEVSELVGTEVKFVMDSNTSLSLNELFKEYASTNDPADLSVGTTMIQLKLYDTSDLWISRSQAKRVLAGLEKFKKVIFDFSGVEVVGQAFCDQIFRIFHHEHPEIELVPINMNESVEIMVNRALTDPMWE